jgi:hypothetical protein
VKTWSLSTKTFKDRGIFAGKENRCAIGSAGSRSKP